jgi:amino acid adenylation domain-containing protein
MARFLLTHAITAGAEHTPDKEAVRFSGKGLSYAELESRTNSLARLLIEQGVRRGDRVGIFMNKGLESAVAIYGIMKAGAAYVPLDPFAPVARVAFVIQDCGIRHLLTKEAKADQVQEIMEIHRQAGAPTLECLVGLPGLDGSNARCFTWEQAYSLPGQPLAHNLTEQDLAYILYTSGSTGTPKGIMHTHRSGLSFAEWAADEYGLHAGDRLSNHAPLHFDLSTFDFFAGAIAGATTVVIPEALTKFPANLSRLMQDERISVWYSVPFALMQLMERGVLETRDLSALRWLLFAGEVFPTKHLRQLMNLLPDVRFSNLFGPTETNVCSYYHVPEPPVSDDTIPIGKACANIEDLVVDAEGKPVAPGEVGELLIRGGVVMKGYWGQPERTANGFFKRRVFGDFDDIFYHTGDLVHLDEQGDYRYLGRKDRQIKTRGYRVELDEIEVALLAHEAVEEAAVYPVPDGQGSNLIAASVIPAQGVELSESVLVEHLGKRLPPYAIPVEIELAGDFPRTSTGKINRRELQAAATQRRQEAVSSGQNP